MSQIVADAFGPKRLTMFLLAFFAAVALALSALGLYAIVAFSVSERTHEIGIRMSVGARPRDIHVLVLRQGVRLTGTGVALGLAGAVAVPRLMGSLLYGVSGTDPVTLFAVAVPLAGLTIAAAALPARRAARIDPMAALRAE
jgi:putative ABC transport system permease protein